MERLFFFVKIWFQFICFCGLFEKQCYRHPFGMVNGFKKNSVKHPSGVVYFASNYMVFGCGEGVVDSDWRDSSRNVRHPFAVACYYSRYAFWTVSNAALDKGCLFKKNGRECIFRKNGGECLC